MLRNKYSDAAVVQLVRISACHAEGRGFESRPLRHFSFPEVENGHLKQVSFLRHKNDTVVFIPQGA